MLLTFVLKHPGLNKTSTSFYQKAFKYVTIVVSTSEQRSMTTQDKAETSHRSNKGGPLPSLQTRRVMIPLTGIAVLFVLLIGVNAPEPPTFRPLPAGTVCR